jgi:hypothetical protein
MNQNVLRISIISVICFCSFCTPKVERRIAASPGKTRAPYEIRLAKYKRSGNGQRVWIQISPTENITTGTFLLRGRDANRIRRTETKFLHALPAGQTATIDFELLAGISDSENPVLDAQVVIAGINYNSSHDIVIHEPVQAPPKKGSAKEFTHVKEVK